MASSGTSRLADEAERCLDALADGELESTVAFRAVIEPCVRFDLPRVLPSCRGKLIDTRLRGDVDPTPALTVRLRVDGITLGQARETFLDPSHWKRASGWCDMAAAPLDPALTSGSRRFLEVVSTSCEPGVVPPFEFRVWLDFSEAVSVGSGRLLLTYKMSPPDVQSNLLVDGEGANGFLAIDEGSLAVLDKETHLEVTTTKRLRYASEATGRAGLILACGAGFAEMGAAVHRTGERRTRPSRGVELMQENPPSKHATDTPPPADPFADAVSNMTASIREWADAAKSSYDKAVSGSYTTKDLAADVAGMAAHAWPDWARMLTSAASVASSLASTPITRPPTGGEAIASDSVAWYDAESGGTQVSNPLSEALEGLKGTTRDWTDAALDHATIVALRLDDDVYAADADLLSADVAKSLALMARGWAQAAGALLEAAVKIAEPPAPVRRITTESFDVTTTSPVRTLTAVGPTWPSPSGAELDTEHVHFEPAALEDGATSFRMVIDADGLPGYRVHRHGGGETSRRATGGGPGHGHRPDLVNERSVVRRRADVPAPTQLVTVVGPLIAVTPVSVVALVDAALAN